MANIEPDKIPLDEALGRTLFVPTELFNPLQTDCMTDCPIPNGLSLLSLLATIRTIVTLTKFGELFDGTPPGELAMLYIQQLLRELVTTFEHALDLTGRESGLGEPARLLDGAIGLSIIEKLGVMQAVHSEEGMAYIGYGNVPGLGLGDKQKLLEYMMQYKRCSDLHYSIHGTNTTRGYDLTRIEQSIGEDLLRMNVLPIMLQIGPELMKCTKETFVAVAQQYGEWAAAQQVGEGQAATTDATGKDVQVEEKLGPGVLSSASQRIQNLVSNADANTKRLPLIRMSGNDTGN